MRFFGGISNAESGLAGVSVRPAFPWVPTVSQVSVPPRGAVTGSGVSETRWPPRMRRAGVRPPGLQFPEECAGGRRREPLAPS